MEQPFTQLHVHIEQASASRLTALKRAADAVLRRLLDIVGSAAGLVVLSPLFVLIAILIKRDSEGPIHYWGPRAGRGGKPFRILKFRTMYERPESYQGPKITGSGDPRITPVGQWLRDTKLNELPQLWNVLKGEMSLVGPRPEDPDFVEKWPADARKELLAVRPGITSPASIVYRNEEEMLRSGNVVGDYLRDILPGKLRLDRLYVRHRTVLRDLDIIFLTAVTLIPIIRRRPVPEHALFWGPVSRVLDRHFSWLTVDFLAALTAVGVSGLIWRSSAPLHVGWAASLFLALLIAVAFTAANGVVGLHRIYWSKAPAGDALKLLLTTTVATCVVTSITIFLSPLLPLPYGMVVVTGILAFVFFATLRYRERLFTGLATRWLNLRGQAQASGERALIVGAGQVGSFATWLLRESDLAQVFSIVGLVDDSPRLQGLEVDGVSVVGHTANIPDLVKENDVDLIIFAISDITVEERKRILGLCRRTTARVVLMPDVMESVQTRLLTEDRTEPTQNDMVSNGVHDPSAVEMKPFDLPGWVSRLEQLIAAECWDEVQHEVQRVRRELSVHSTSLLATRDGEREGPHA